MIYVNFLPILIISHLTSSASWDVLSTQTPKQPHLGFLAVQTGAPTLPTSVCGYFPDSGYPLSCLPSDYCGFDGPNELFGCCTAAILYGNSYALYGCEWPSTCYQTIQTPPSGVCFAGDFICCHSSCQTDPSALYWQVFPTTTEATSTACVEFQLSVPGGVYSAYACSTSNALFNIVTSPVAVGAAATTLNNLSPRSSESSTLATTESIPPTAVEPVQTITVSSFIPQTATQKTAGGETTVSVLPLSTTKTGVAGRVNPTWGLVIICVGLGISA